MKAAVVHTFGVPRYGDFEEPSVSDKYAILEVVAAGLNNVDAVTARGGLAETPTLPFVAGREGVGIFEGRRVYFDGPVAPFGSMADRTLIDPDKTFTVPEQLDDGKAIAIGIAGLAAWLSLSWRAGLSPNETVLILGGSGVVGQIAVQAARLQGAGRVVVLARSPSGRELTERLGADATVALTSDETAVAQGLKDAVGTGANVVIDLLGGSLLKLCLPACAPHARYIQVGNLAGPLVSFHAPLLRERMVSLLGYTTRHAPFGLVRSAYAEMAALALSGDLRIDVDEVPLTEVATAWQRLASAGHRKIILRP